MTETRTRPAQPFPWTMVRFSAPDRQTTTVNVVGMDDDAIAARIAEGWTLTEEWQVDVCVCGDRFRVDDPQRHADRHADGHVPISVRDAAPPCQHVSRAGERS